MVSKVESMSKTATRAIAVRPNAEIIVSIIGIVLALILVVELMV